MTEEKSFGERYGFISNLGDTSGRFNVAADLRQYHDALNNLATLVLNLKEIEERASVVLESVGVEWDALSGLDFTGICAALAVGHQKMGWPTDPRLVATMKTSEERPPSDGLHPGHDF